MQIELSPTGGFRLIIPAVLGVFTHSVDIPCTWQGMMALRRLLIERERAPFARLGTPASPTQAMINEWLRLNPPPPVTDNDDEIEINI